MELEEDSVRGPINKDIFVKDPTSMNPLLHGMPHAVLE